MSTRTIKVDLLARVEGEGGIFVKVKGDRVAEVKLNIFEPPRFLEALLRGRDFREAADITARICGICPVAYQMSAVHAMENALGVKVDGQLRSLRRLLYCGEWIESHALHIYMLHAPDFLGYEDSIAIARDHPDIVKRGLQLKKVGNEIVALLGGREIHPINVRVGGFYKAPLKRDFTKLVERLKWAREAALETVWWVAKFPFPDFEQDYTFVSLRHPDEYPFNEGRMVSSSGLDIAVRNYEDHFVEEHVAHSTSLHSGMRENTVNPQFPQSSSPYLVGPLARFNLNFDRLCPLAQEAAREAGLDGHCRNPFRSIIVRAVEALHACEEALRIIDRYEPPSVPAVAIEPRASTGYACTEAPRGTLYHRYRLDERGIIVDAKIVPPTSQNYKRMELDLAQFIPSRLNLLPDSLRRQCEQAVRNYDPCISCSTHFLKLTLQRE